MTDVDASLMQQILHIPERQRKPDIEHHRQADDLGAGLEVLERGTLGHDQKLRKPPARLKPSSSDITFLTMRLSHVKGRKIGGT